MKKFALILTLGALSSICLMNCAEQSTKAGHGGEKPIVVPQGKTYVVLNEQQKEIARFSTGQVMAKGITDCAMIPCPQHSLKTLCVGSARSVREACNYSERGDNQVCVCCANSVPPAVTLSLLLVRPHRAES